MTELDAQALWVHRKHEALGEHFGFNPEAVGRWPGGYRPPSRRRGGMAPSSTQTQTTAAAKVHAERTIATLAAEIHARGPYLLGAEFSAADILFTHCLSWAANIGWGEKWTARGTSDERKREVREYLSTMPRDAPSFAALARYEDRCHGRPAYERAYRKSLE